MSMNQKGVFSEGIGSQTARYSRTHFGLKLSSIFIPSMLLGFLAVFISVILGYSISASASTSATTGASPVSVTLENLMALRVLDKTATSVIDSISMDLDPTPNGSFTKNSMMVEVSTRNSSGYTLYLTSAGQGYTNSELAYTNALVFMDGESPSTTVSDKIPSLPAGTAQSPTSITEAEYSVRNSLYRNTWGYSTNSYTITQTEDSSANLEASNGTGVINTITENTNPTAITYTDIPEHSINKTVKQTDSTAVLDLTPITVGVNSTSTNAAGTYQNTLEFTATGNAIPANYSLSFNKNGYDSGNTGSTTPEGITESTISGMPSTNPMTATSVATSYTFTLPSAGPETSASGYSFRGWNTAPDGTGTFYAPGSSFTITADDADPSSTSKTLYAIWGQNNFWSITYMQEMTSDICNSVYTPSNATGSSVTMITDEATYNATVSGDNMPYVAQRTLYDYRGLDGTGSKSSPASGDNVAAYTIAKLADGNCWMTSNLKLGLSTSQAIEVVTNSTGEAKSTKWTPTGSGGTSNASTPMNGNTVCTGSGDSRKCWYSWYAATAGSGTSGQTSTDASDSICPAGWRLPSNYTTSTTKSYSALTNAYFGIINNTNNVNYKSQLQSRPLNFSSDGHYYSGKLDNIGYPYYISTTVDSEGWVYVFVYHSTQTAPQATDGKYSGESIRCLAV